MAGMWMRNRPHGPTRVSAKSAANGKLEAEQRIWPDPCLDPNLFACYKVILHENPDPFVCRGLYVFLR